MKYSLSLLLLLPFFVLAQDCNLKTQKDVYTKEIKISTGFISLRTGQLSIEATKAEIDFMFSFGSGKCFDDASAASVFYEGTRLKTNFKNSGTMNCDGLFHFTFRNTNPSPSALQNLATKKISSIRFKDNTNKETSVTFTAEQQQMLLNLINCIINEAKKLL
ncbi:MAG TPA: hypothetical protein VGQ09_00920 [Chitinophagaceae bacterium]|jgi:hypothetical protein|nr:hypothetical protein [Chitinophagaceae bacterium]